MDTDDKNKQTKIKDHEFSLDENWDTDTPDNFNMDMHLTESNLLGWIELIENPDLHKAVKSLSIEDQIFISYIVKECRTQRELAELYNVDQRTIGRKF